MHARIPQEQREQQIKQLCEGTLYSFTGWDGEYKNSQSRVVIKCESHGVQSITIANFIHGYSRCTGCRYEKARRTNVRSEQETVLLLQSKGFQFLRWKEPYVNQYSVAIFHCEAHGEYEKDVAHALLRDAKCQKCSGLYRWSREEREQQITNKNRRYKFLGWVTDYKNNSSRIKMQCEFGHEWNVSLASYLDKPIGCPRCGGTGRYEEQELIERMNDSLKEGTKFLRWVNGYGNHRKAIFECCLHGEWTTSASSVIHQGSGCPACAVSGFNPTLKGYVYCLRSEDGQSVKVGISNYLSKRIRQLKRNTPFDFHLIENVKFENGHHARQLEKLFHQSFASANLTGFDGATEWLKWTPEIQGWFRFLK